MGSTEDDSTASEPGADELDLPDEAVNVLKINVGNVVKMRSDLLNGRKSIAIHGLGFIGTSLAMAYAHEGVKSICYDINPEKVLKYVYGICDVRNLEEWSMMKLKPFVDDGMITPTEFFEDLKDCPVHFICVPTHRDEDGKPYMTYIESCLTQSEQLNKDVAIVIESTLSPNWIRELGLEARNVIVAPRRDWFSDPKHNLKNLPRVYGCSNRRMDFLAKKVLSIVCDHMVRASSMRMACLTKAGENADWHIRLVARQQLAIAYGEEDVNELSYLISTHPRMDYIFPSMKVGGYCVPMGTAYILAGCHNPEILTLYSAALKANEENVEKILTQLAWGFPDDVKVAVMGITYKSDLKIHTLTAAMDILKHYPSAKVHDPYYSEGELKEILNAESFNYPDDLDQFNVIIILTDHKLYYRTPLNILTEKISGESFIIDNLGVWYRHRNQLPGAYYRFGSGTLVSKVL